MEGTDAFYWWCTCSKSWQALVMTLMPSQTQWWNKQSSRQQWKECHLVKENCGHKKTQIKKTDSHAWPICAFWKSLKLLRMLHQIEWGKEAVAWRRPQNIFCSFCLSAVFGYACLFPSTASIGLTNRKRVAQGDMVTLHSHAWKFCLPLILR